MCERRADRRLVCVFWRCDLVCVCVCLRVRACVCVFACVFARARARVFSRARVCVRARARARVFGRQATTSTSTAASSTSPPTRRTARSSSTSPRCSPRSSSGPAATASAAPPSRLSPMPRPPRGRRPTARPRTPRPQLPSAAAGAAGSHDSSAGLAADGRHVRAPSARAARRPKPGSPPAASFLGLVRLEITGRIATWALGWALGSETPPEKEFFVVLLLQLPATTPPLCSTRQRAQCARNGRLRRSDRASRPGARPAQRRGTCSRAAQPRFM